MEYARTGEIDWNGITISWARVDDESWPMIMSAKVDGLPVDLTDEQCDLIEEHLDELG